MTTPCQSSRIVLARNMLYHNVMIYVSDMTRPRKASCSSGCLQLLRRPACTSNSQSVHRNTFTDCQQGPAIGKEKDGVLFLKSIQKALQTLSANVIQVGVDLLDRDAFPSATATATAPTDGENNTLGSE